MPFGKIPLFNILNSTESPIINFCNKTQVDILNESTLLSILLFVIPVKFICKDSFPNKQIGIKPSV